MWTFLLFFCQSSQSEHKLKIEWRKEVCHLIFLSFSLFSFLIQLKILKFLVSSKTSIDFWNECNSEYYVLFICSLCTSGIHCYAHYVLKYKAFMFSQVKNDSTGRSQDLTAQEWKNMKEHASEPSFLSEKRGSFFHSERDCYGCLRIYCWFYSLFNACAQDELNRFNALSIHTNYVKSLNGKWEMLHSIANY